MKLWEINVPQVYCHETDTVGQLKQRIVSASNVPVEHKLLVHKGLLLQVSLNFLTDA